MRKTVFICSMLLLFSVFAGSAWAGSEGASNTFYGSNAGAATIGDNDNVAFFGTEAGLVNTGQANTFIGYHAGYNNTTGDDNTFLGRGAGIGNTTENHNTYVGRDSGYKGSYNTCIGSGACYWNVANNNTFMGYRAGYYNSTGTYNTFIGPYAGYGQNNLSTGSYNFFMGFEAGKVNTTGTANTFIGTLAGRDNTSGEHNIFLGYGSGVQNITGKNNVYIGDYSGYNEKAGVGNVFIGYMAGYNYTGSNKLYIANSGTNIPLIWGDFSTGVVKVNGAIVQTSSREYKDKIEDISSQEAMETLEKLNPVKYVYKTNPNDQQVGFIAEDVPELVATQDRKGMSSMDVVAVLTKVIKEQQGFIQEQQKINAVQAKKIAELEQMIVSK